MKATAIGIVLAGTTAAITLGAAAPAFATSGTAVRESEVISDRIAHLLESESEGALGELTWPSGEGQDDGGWHQFASEWSTDLGGAVAWDSGITPDGRPVDWSQLEIRLEGIRETVEAAFADKTAEVIPDPGGREPARPSPAPSEAAPIATPPLAVAPAVTAGGGSDVASATVAAESPKATPPLPPQPVEAPVVAPAAEAYLPSLAAGDRTTASITPSTQIGTTPWGAVLALGGIGVIGAIAVGGGFVLPGSRFKLGTAPEQALGGTALGR